MTDVLGEVLAHDRLGDVAASPGFDRVALVVGGDDDRLAVLDVTRPGAEPVVLPAAPVGVTRCVWHPRGDRLLVSVDAVGAERDRVAELDARTGAELWSTVDDAVHAIGPMNDRHARPYRPDGAAVAYSSTARDERHLDVVVRDLATGEVSIAMRGDGRCYPVAWSSDGARLLVKRVHQNTEHELFVCEPGSGRVRRLLPGVLARFTHAAWAAGDDRLVLLTDAGRDLLTPALLDVATGAVSWLAEPDLPAPGEPATEIATLVTSPDGTRAAWGRVRAGRSSWTVADLATGETAAVPALPDGALAEPFDNDGHVAAHLDARGATLVTSVDRPTAPAEVWLVDLTGGGSRPLTRLGARVPAARLTAPSHVTIPSRDGSPIPAQLFRPPGAAGRVPVVVALHGGPESAQPRGLVPEIQGLLRHGVGVLAPDIRGSVGHGRAYQRLSIHDWGGGDVRDVVDCVAFLRGVEWADTGRLGIMGGSYGGFLTLACLTQHPELWRVGVDVFGPSDLITAAEAMPPHWQGRIAGWLGDLADPADRARLADHSPLTHADRITAPLLVVQGAHDPRVTRPQADRLVERLTELGRTVRHVTFADEGHGFTRRVTVEQHTRRVVEWLVSHLAAGPPGSGGAAT